MKVKSTHRPITPGEESDADRRVLRQFFMPALLYAIRHLTVGTVIRCRRAYLKWRGRKYYI